MTDICVIDLSRYAFWGTSALNTDRIVLLSLSICKSVVDRLFNTPTLDKDRTGDLGHGSMFEHCAVPLRKWLAERVVSCMILAGRQGSHTRRQSSVDIPTVLVSAIQDTSGYSYEALKRSFTKTAGIFGLLIMLSRNEITKNWGYQNNWCDAKNTNRKWEAFAIFIGDALLQAKWYNCSSVSYERCHYCGYFISTGYAEKFHSAVI